MAFVDLAHHFHCGCPQNSQIRLYCCLFIYFTSKAQERIPNNIGNDLYRELVLIAYLTTYVHTLTNIQRETS